MSRFLRLPLMTVMALFMAMMLAACGTTPSSPTTTTPQSGTQSIVVKDALNGTLSLSAPTGTFHSVDEMSGSVTIATSEALLSSAQLTVLSQGQWQLIVGALPSNVAQALVPGGQTVSPQTMVDAIKTQMSAAQIEPKVTFAASAPTTIAGHEAARVTGTSSQGDVVVIVVALDGSYLLVTGVTSVGQLATYEPTFTTIINSATYVPAS